RDSSSTLSRFLIKAERISIEEGEPKKDGPSIRYFRAIFLPELKRLGYDKPSDWTYAQFAVLPGRCALTIPTEGACSFICIISETQSGNSLSSACTTLQYLLSDDIWRKEWFKFRICGKYSSLLWILIRSSLSAYSSIICRLLSVLWLFTITYSQLL